MLRWLFKRLFYRERKRFLDTIANREAVIRRHKASLVILREKMNGAFRENKNLVHALELLRRPTPRVADEKPVCPSHGIMVRDGSGYCCPECISHSLANAKVSPHFANERNYKMTHGTIEETFEYRITQVVNELIRQTIEKSDLKNSDELFDYLDENQQLFGKLIIEDMVTWDSPDNWFTKVAV